MVSSTASELPQARGEPAQVLIDIIVKEPHYFASIVA